MWLYFIPIYLGVAAVLQGGLNRQIAEGWGLPGTALMNSLVLITISCSVYCVARFAPQVLPAAIQDKASFTNLSWVHFIPGLLGYSLVLGLAWAIREIGAAKVFIILISAQLCTSLVWDHFVEGIPINWLRMTGATLSTIGALIFVLGS